MVADVCTVISFITMLTIKLLSCIVSQRIGCVFVLLSLLMKEDGKKTIFGERV